MFVRKYKRFRNRESMECKCTYFRMGRMGQKRISVYGTANRFLTISQQQGRSGRHMGKCSPGFDLILKSPHSVPDWSTRMGKFRKWSTLSVRTDQQRTDKCHQFPTIGTNSVGMREKAIKSQQ